MKQLILPILSLILVTGCSKEYMCTGSDCVHPEGTVTIDSIIGDQYFVTLTNNEGEDLAYPLTLSPEISQEDFMEYTMMNSQPSMTPGNENPDQKTRVYYISADQSYVLNEADFIHANETTLEISGYGQNP